MIKGILLTISIIVLVAVIGLAVWLGIKAFRSSAGAEIAKIKHKYENKIDSLNSWDGNYIEKKKALKTQMDAEIEEYKKSNTGTGKGGFLASVIGSIVLFAFVLTVPGSFHQVEAGSVAVVKELGKIVGVHTPGTYFDFYMTKNYEIYDTTVQQVQIKTAAYSHDAQSMDLELYLQYQIQLDKLIIRDTSGNIIQSEGIAGKYVTLSSLQARIETQCIEKTKAVMSAEHFYEADPITVTTTTTITLTSTQYTIDITTGPGADKFKELVEDYLKYLEYLKVWNGELPDVVAGDDAISIIVPNGN